MYKKCKYGFQNVTLKPSSQAGQLIALEPGRGLSLNLRSQAGHAISTLTILGLIVNCVSQDEHAILAGLVSTPQTRTLEQEGQDILSSFHS